MGQFVKDWWWYAKRDFLFIRKLAYGKKMYIQGGATITYAILGKLLGELDWNQTMLLLYAGFGLLFAKAAIVKSGPRLPGDSNGS